MSAMDKVNNILGKLPFVKLAGNIPEGIRGKIPFLNVLIPFANHIASGAAIVVLVACFGGGGGTASTNDFSYRLIGEDDVAVTGFGYPVGLSVSGYSGKGGKVVIPAIIEGYPVVSMSGFRGIVNETYTPAYQITELVIPDTVEYMDDYTFFHCENLKSMNLPANLKHLGDEVFDACEELQNITIPDSLSGDFGSSSLFWGQKLPLKTRARLKELGIM